MLTDLHGTNGLVQYAPTALLDARAEVLLYFRPIMWVIATVYRELTYKHGRRLPTGVNFAD